MKNNVAKKTVSPRPDRPVFQVTAPHPRTLSARIAQKLQKLINEKVVKVYSRELQASEPC